MRKTATIGFLVVLGYVTQGHAESEQIAAVGAGASTCAEFARSFKETPELTEAVYYSWAQGFMSSQNLMLLLSGQSVHNLKKLSLASAKSHVRAFCDKHPLLPL